MQEGAVPGVRPAIVAPLLLVLLLAGGCSRVPKIIVLEDPLSAAEHVELGVAYERKGELELARREYEKALGKDKNVFQARVNLGNVYLAKKDYAKAREEYLAALSLKPGDPEAVNNLAWAAIFSGQDLPEALKRMEDVLAAQGRGTATLLDTLGVLRMNLSLPEAAEEAFEEAEKACARAESSHESPCQEEVRRDIREHREELHRRFSPHNNPPVLVK